MLANNQREKLQLTNIHNLKVSEQITYSLETPKWFHVELINDYYKGSMKSLIYLEKEVKRMEKEHNNCLWEYGVAVSTLNEMRKALIVGMFHLWLHNLQEYLVMSGNEFHPKKIMFANSGFDTIISIFKDITDKDLIAKIKKYSTLINAIKHGIGKSLTDLKHNYSEFFYPSEEYTKTDDEGYILEDAQEPLVSKYHFEELHKSLLEFWKSVPDKIIVDVNKLGKKD